ncbi:MAG: hypothetical protein AB7O38_24045 [Pirellulaceae bacterium]
MNNPSTETRQARITIRGHMLRISGMAEADRMDLEDMMRVESIGLERNADGRGYLVHREHPSFMGTHRDGRPQTYASFLGRVKKHLTDWGYRVRVYDRTEWRSLAAPNAELLVDSDLTDDGRRYLVDIKGPPLGQVIVPGRHQQFDAIALFCRLHAGTSILVVGATRARREELLHELRHRMARSVELRPQIGEDRPQVVVVTQHDFARVENPRQMFGIVVFADIESALSTKSVRNVTTSYDGALRFAFHHGDRRLHDTDRLVLEAIYGPVIYCDPALRDRLYGATVVFTAPQYGIDWLPKDALDRKRALWSDRRRNAHIVRTALDVPTGRLPDVTAANTDNGVAIDDPTVVIVVESVAHALHLHRLLPDWSLLTGQLEQDLRREYQSGEPRGHTIATFLGAAAVGVHADVVVRADGTSTPWDDQWLARAPAEAPPLLIVDIDDDIDKLARRHAKARRDEYSRRSGCQVCRLSRLAQATHGHHDLPPRKEAALQKPTTPTSDKRVHGTPPDRRNRPITHQGGA